MFEPEGWVKAIVDALARGFIWYDLLGAYDDLGRSDAIIVTLRLRNPTTGQVIELQVGVDRDLAELPDISDLLPGARWGQRYVHDFYGVRFIGADLRPLLNHEGGAPLRKDFVLGARVVAAPSVPDGRKGPIPGIPEPWIWGDRDPELPPPTPAEIIGSGSRRRRR